MTEELYSIESVDDNTKWGDGPGYGANREPPDMCINGTVQYTRSFEEMMWNNPMNVDGFREAVVEAVKREYASVLRRFPSLNVIILEVGDDFVDICLETTENYTHPEDMPARVKNTTAKRDEADRYVEADSVAWWLKGIEAKRCRYCSDFDPQEDIPEAKRAKCGRYGIQIADPNQLPIPVQCARWYLDELYANCRFNCEGTCCGSCRDREGCDKACPVIDYLECDHMRHGGMCGDDSTNKHGVS